MIKLNVKAIGVNRADVFFRQGKYPAEGLEVAGIGADGKRYAAIMDGGAYAREVEIAEECAVEIPPAMSFTDAAAITEALFTAYYNLVSLCALKADENILIHGGASGVGVVAIQLAKLLGANVSATAGKKEKLELIESLGAKPINYTSLRGGQSPTRQSPEIATSPTAPRDDGFGREKYDVILDIVGGDYFNANLAALKKGGRLAIIAFIGGAKVEANLAPLLLKHLSVYGSTIRGLSLAEKQKIRDAIIPFFPKIKPVVDKVFKFEEKELALDYVESYRNVGKVVLES